MTIEGKTFLITGGTEGIGKAAATEFAKRGAKLVLVGRNPEKTDRVARELEAAGRGEKVETIHADLSRLADMRAAAAKFLETHDRLDVLVNNAGAVFFDHQLTADGYEMTFALNHLSYFVVTNALLGVLERTPGSRVISTSSGAHASGRIDFDQIAKRPGKGAGFRVYCDSKLANILFTRELARRLADKGVAVSCFHPGFVQTGFAKNNQGLFASLIGFGASLFARTPEKGAETLVWLATSPDAAKPDGEYFFDMKVTRTRPLGNDRALAKKLWAFTEELVA
ncbi:MAG: SDR family oxidoreductase [Polyangiaceae bacterium]